MRLGRAVEAFHQEARIALRALRRAPGFTATVMATLGLAIGANTAMFTVVDQLMFRPLAYLRDPGSVHRIYWQWQDRGATVTTLSTQYTRYLDIARWTSSFSQLAAFSERNLAVGEGEATRERRVGTVSASFFELFDAHPALGRFFTADEDRTPRGSDVAVLSHAFWQGEYGGRNVLGQPLQVGNIRATIIGVAPPGFNGVNDADPPSVYVPITTYAGSTGTDDARTYYTRYQWGWVNILVRRAPGVQLERAQADASRAFERSWQAGRGDDPLLPPFEAARPRVTLSSVRPGAGPNPALEARTALWVSLVAAMVLLIACANITNLFLMRGLRREHESAVRIALGAGRHRLILQSVGEGMILAVAGGIAALLIANFVGSGIRGLLIAPSTSEIRVLGDARTFAFTLGLIAISGIAVGLAPSLLAGRVNLASVLRTARGGSIKGGRVRASLLIVQIALSVVLLTGATLFVRSLGAVRNLHMGYDPEPVLLVNRVIGGNTFHDSIQVPLRRALLSAAQSLPAVESAAWVATAPFVSTSSTNLYVEGIDSVGLLGTFTYQATTADYFRTMGTRIVRGRSLTEVDRQGAPLVAVISESMARVLWQSRDPIGQCFRMRAVNAPCITVVGVAEDIIQRSITETERFHYYLPIEQHSDRWWGNGMVLKLRGDPVQLAENVRTTLQRLVPSPSYLIAQPLKNVVQRQARSWQMGATLFLAFGALATLVTGVGLYGAIACNVRQRMHELGVRVALGAQHVRLVWLVLTHTGRLALIGSTSGVLIALLAAGRIQPLLFHTSARDLRVHAGVCGILFAVALAASMLPAIRAANADPNLALRSE